VKFRVTRKGPRTPHRDAVNRARSRIRAHVEHPFLVVKRLWGFTKVRYRGLAKNATRAFAALMLANLYLLRRRLVAA
jgi:IS5 family transposase